jgi:ribosomal protein S1
VVDLGGLDGFVHISELAHHRVERAEDVVSVGERGTFRVLSVERSDRGLRVRLSRKALEQAPAAPKPPAADEVLKASVKQLANHGVFVHTARGDGLVPIAELKLPPGSDHRRAYPVGKEFDVVRVSRDGAMGGKLRFSERRVEDVLERRNYREFSAGGQSSGGSSMGSLGTLLRQKLGLPEPPPDAAPAPKAEVPKSELPKPEAPAAEAASAKPAPAPSPAAAEPQAKPHAPSQEPKTQRELPGGVVRRKKED